MIKPFLKGALAACSLFAVSNVSFCGVAKAEFSPAGIKNIAVLKGQWSFKNASDLSNAHAYPRAPAVNFSSGPNHLLINFDGKLPPHLQDSLNIALSNTYFGCNGEDFRLWFNNGDYIPLEVGRCDHGHIYLHIPIGVKDEIWAFYYKLADFIQSGARPIEISESATGLKLSYPDDKPLKSFREATNPKTNQPYFDAIKQYWAKFEQKHSIDLLKPSSFVPLDTEIIGSLKGAWRIHQDAKLFPDDLPPPTLLFTAGPVQLAISMTSSAKDFRNPKSIIVREFVHMNLCSLYFKCNAGSVKLWFDNGEYIETAPAVCLNDSIFATSSKGDLAEKEDNTEKKLSTLMRTQRPVALTQGKYAVSLDYSDMTALEQFRKLSDPKSNSAYFEAQRKYYQDKADK
ncbi:hypothetical protein FAI41_04550 [Acetobacteraceae bacterium]|nr:hypothetical protein FAI41_04550 [Acetobacteraceae bacterium]